MRVWQAVNLVDDTTITFRNLRYVLSALRNHEARTGHFIWKLRSFVAPSPSIGVRDPERDPKFLPAEVAL